MAQSPPFDDVAEKSAIGAMLIDRDIVSRVLEIVSPDDFYKPVHWKIVTAISSLYEQGLPIDSTMVIDEAQRLHLGLDTPAVMLEMQIGVPSALHGPHYAKIVREKSLDRRLLKQCTEVVQGLYDGTVSALTAADDLGTQLAGLGAVTDEAQAKTLRQLALTSVDKANWIIPGLLRRDWRAIVVAPEGVGKAVLMRTMGMSAAQGFSPFRHTDLPRGPIRVLIVDAENPEAAILETGTVLEETLRQMAGDDFDEERVKWWHVPQGIDIRGHRDYAALQREIAHQKPDLVLAGPIYKMFSRYRGEEREDAVEDFCSRWDKLRIKYGFALVLEHHAPKGDGKGNRPLVPFGSQRFMAWPEMGITMEPSPKDPKVINIGRYRFDRMKAEWPEAVRWDRDWLFAEVFDTVDTPGMF